MSLEEIMAGHAATAAQTMPKPLGSDQLELTMQEYAADQRRRMQGALATSVKTNPDAYAAQKQLAKYVGVPPIVAQTLPDEIKSKAAVQRVQADTVDAPLLARSYTDADFAKLAHDDSGVLSAIEAGVRWLVSAPSRDGKASTLAGDVAASYHGMTQGAAGAFQGLTETASYPLDVLENFPRIGGNPLRRLSEGFGLIARQAAADQKAAAGESKTWMGGAISSGVQSLGQNLAMITLALLPGGQAAALTGMAATAGGQSYQEDRAKGVGHFTALGHGLSDAVIEAATEAVPMGRLIKDVKAGGPLWKAITANAAREVPGEQVATALQDLNDWAVNNEGKTFGDYLAAEAAAQTLIATLVGVGGNVAVSHGIQGAVDRATGAQRQAQQAELHAQALGQLATLAEASKLRERDPEQFQTFAQSLADQNVPSLYVDPRALQAAGVDMQALAQALPSVAPQLEQAIATGGDLVIPTGEFVTHAPGQVFQQALVEHARTAEDAMSPAEAKTYMAEHGDKLQAEIARVIEQKAGDETWQAGRDQVRAEFQRQLDEVRRFTPDVNKTYATVLGDFYAVTAAKAGMSPQELAQRYPLRIASKLGEGENVMDQPQLPVDSEGFVKWFDKSHVVDEDGRPAVVYHGTPAGGFDTFDPSKAGTRGTFESARAGMFFTSNPDYANAMSRSPNEAAPTVYPVFLSVQNPLRVHSTELTDEAEIDAMLAQAKEGGHDGIMDEYGNVVVFRPEQIKSATGNRGTFDPNDPSILNQFAGPRAAPAQPARAQIAFGRDITQQTTTLTLLKDADLSSFIHEAGHFFLEVQADLAARIEARIADGEQVSDGERGIVADMNRLLDWFGVKASPEQSAIGEWHAMTLEQKREHHETFARGFERYAFEGKAPSLALQPLLQRFRAWMVNIYKSLKALNVELTPEVRGVMDRMLATTQQIKEAEAARNMGALFQTPEQAGMTPEQWAAYHHLAVDATQQAIENLQARGLRDMTWQRNATSRELKKLQDRAKGLRREIEREVRAEVMSQPVYRAWAFLTGKGEPDQQAQAAPRVKATGELDNSRDNLFVAIAKLGGLNRAEVESQWGIRPKDERLESGVFGKPVVRREGGLSLDAMAERLVEEGYLLPDEHGKADLRDLEEAFDSQRRGQDQFSIWHDYAERAAAANGEQSTDALPEHATHGKLDTETLREMYGTQPDALWRKLSTLRMTSDKVGIHPDVVAETFGFSGGDEMVRALAAADHPMQVIEGLADQRMLERYGDLATPEGLQRAADQAVHTEYRARAIATELSALEAAGKVRQKVPGQRNTADMLVKAAKEYAAAVIGASKVRDIKPSRYAAAEARAGAAAEKHFKAGDTQGAAAEKRNQVIQHEAARAAYAAQDEVEKATAYLRKFDRRPKGLDTAYADQIDSLLERFDLKPASLKDIDRRASLAEWVASQQEQGMEPDIPPELLREASRKSWRDMTLDELRGLRDTVRQIDVLGRLKGKLLTAQAQREFEAVRDELADSITQHAGDRKADTRTPATVLGRKLAAVKAFGAAHIKAATWARILDGGKDGGPVWEYLIRGANRAGDFETTRRAQATEALTQILAPVLKQKMGGKGVFFKSINRTMNREQVFSLALNTGNEGNLQRLLDGEGWTQQQIQPVLATLTAAEWRAVQGVWDHFESYRPEIGAKERRIYGKEPNWVEPAPFNIQSADGVAVVMRGGYYPIKYDPLANNRAEQHSDAESAKRELQGAYTSATTRRGFTKSRTAEVSGRPILYSLAGIYSGVNDVIHDLAWHEWLIDTNKLLRSEKVDGAIRQHYGPQVVKQFKTWVKDTAAGEGGLQAELDSTLGRLRHGVSIAGLGFNVMSAVMQPLGLTQSIVRVGAGWIGKGVAQYVANPRAATRRVNDASEFMAGRARTRFRELAELRNQVEGQSKARDAISTWAYFLMMRCQQMVDVPTWLGAYEKAISEGNTEERAVALADQAVIDAQGGGQTKDLSAIERGGPAQKLFMVFYGFMNTALNVGTAQTMTAAKTPKARARLAADYLLLYSVPAVLGAVLKDALTPGDSGDWDDPEKLLKKLLGEQLAFLMGLMVVVREFAEAGKTALSLSEHPRDYSGPAGVRLISDTSTMAKQAAQGEFDDQFRKAAVNLMGDLFALPAAQVNRTITGAQALADGKTSNPAALVFGFQAPH
jgi:hypothetical protein